MTTAFLNVPSINSLRLLLIAVFWLISVAFTGSASAEGPPGPPLMEITFQNNLISAELVDVPLIDVLQRIKQELGFKAHFYGDLNEVVTLSFTDMPLDKCLRQLTADHSLSVAFLPAAKSSEQNQTKQIAEIWVLSRSTAPKNLNSTSAAPVLPSVESSADMVRTIEKSPEEPGNQEQDATLDSDKSSQRQAISNLAEIGGSASVLAMAEYLGTEEDKEVRRMLVNGISSVQNEESTQVLGQVIQNEPDPEIRIIAIRALGQRQDDNTARAYLEQALNDDDEEIKALVNQLLAE